MTLATDARSISTAQATWLVAERDILSRLRSKAFIISTLILVLIAVGGIVWMGISSATTSGTPVAATADSAEMLPDTEDLEVTEVADAAAGEALVRDGTVDAFVTPSAGSATGVEVVALDEAPDDVTSLLAVHPEVTLLEDPAVPFFLRYMLGLIFGVLFMGITLTFAMPIATAVVEEKQTRVVEILISTVSARALLAGKVLGNLILALGQIVVLAAASIIGLAVTGQGDFVTDFGAPVAWFAVFFALGFLLLSAMFAAAGSMVSRQEDISPTVMPVMYLVMLPYFLVVLFGNNPVLMNVMSYVPFSAPTAMPVRLYFNEAAWWEPVLSLGVLAVSCVIIIAVGARIYENSLLKMGGRVKVREALKG
ncbi:ABC transporter permease [Microbacterium sp. JB110]|uniref:ABC transporter permease n=1 Tax=Microbacterium sp. JB110 TaxID=2024477 RepID=UPI00097F3EE6|nr:ABC transporter permease [Microbacterium sp. JB110]RCS60884.1 ABC transporter permease [Microbacterium sp. JB110]SJM64250.1 ABC transporter [Frigoribacterium sp. JB110]